MGRPRVEHPSRQAWVTGRCRCARCHRLAIQYARVWRAAQVLRRGGEPAGRHPPHKVRAHVDRLRAAGWTITDIAKASGVHWRTVFQHAHHRAGAVALTTQAAILAVEPESIFCTKVLSRS